MRGGTLWLLLLIGGSIVHGCTVGELALVGRPCGPRVSCAPGTTCDEARGTCVLPSRQPDSATPLDLDRSSADQRPNVLDHRGSEPDLPRRDARLEARPPDQRPREAKPADLRADTRPPDHKINPCQQKYGAVFGFLLCAQTTTTCTFYYGSPSSPWETCNTICSSGGGSCQGAYSDAADTCAASANVSCNASNSDGICVCTR